MRRPDGATPPQRAAVGIGPDVVVSEFCIYPVLRLLRQAGQVEYDPGLGRDPDQLSHRLRQAAALVVRNQTQVTEALLEGAPRLRVVGRLGAGLDNIDLEACRRRGVRVVYAPTANAVSVAEMTLTLALALAKDLPTAVRLGRMGVWNRASYRGREIAGKTWGILGFGAVGHEVAKRVRALGMTVVAHHPRRGPEHSDWGASGVTPLTRNEVLATSDVLSLHLPLTAETRLSFGRSELTRMKPGAYLINTSRGDILDEAALVDALEKNRLAGVALDVRQSEPPSPGDRLTGMENVLLTPHLAGLTEESQERVCRSVAEDVLRVLQGEEPLSPWEHKF